LLVHRLYLRNYRVFEDELDLEVPPGLVGIYGPNGAGKSTLLEAVGWALWGDARTPKDGIASSGTHGECVAELTFEHEGHLYLVRRTITGANATVRAQAHCDGLAMAEGARDTSRYVHSVLGMDLAAFKASVFAEQKQLAAFSEQAPAERRRLVLSLLGVTPLDTARDRARSEARERAAEHTRLRGLLPDLGQARVTAADAEARAAAAEVSAVEEERAAASARERAEAARQGFSRLDRARQDHEQLVLQGKAAKAELEAAEAEVASLSKELEGLSRAEARIAELAPAAAQLAEAEERLQLLKALSEATRALLALPELPEPPEPDEAGLSRAERRARAASNALGGASGRRQAAAEALERAKESLARSEELSGEAECPLCGQPLGRAFAQVQAHRRAELNSAAQGLTAAEEAFQAASAEAEEALSELQRHQQEVNSAREAKAAWEKASGKRADALERRATAFAALASAAPDLGLSPAASREAIAAALQRAEGELSASRSAGEEIARLSGKLERRQAALSSLGDARARAQTAAGEVSNLRAKVRALRFDPAALAEAERALAEAEAAATEAAARAQAARVEAARARAGAEGEAKRLAEAEAQHARLSELASESLHLSRTAELLNAFRNNVVASVGPRLAVQAADLFGELTDNEYDRLEVDPETYGLKICDGGISYELGRFSGSEQDLANLALRVAISEHVRFQSGGAVGLLVLDEVFGPLDDERRARMLIALERLRGRFRQVLVVTHSTEVKDQLPSAIEVMRKPGRRATARLVEP
jgi:exonuclease SbcC